MEVIPSEWYVGIIKSIVKSGNRVMLPNYTGITISLVMYKAVVSITEKQSVDFNESNNLLTDVQ